MVDEAQGSATYEGLIEMAEKLAASGVTPTDAEADQLKAALAQLAGTSAGDLDLNNPGPALSAVL